MLRSSLRARVLSYTHQPSPQRATLLCGALRVLYVAPTLLGEHCIIRIHGRLGHHQHTLPPLIYHDAATAQRSVARLLQRRLKRDYLLLNCQPQQF